MIHSHKRNTGWHHITGEAETGKQLNEYIVHHYTGAVTAITTTLFIAAGGTLVAVTTILFRLLFIMVTECFTRMFMPLIINRLQAITIIFLTGIHNIHWRQH